MISTMNEYAIHLSIYWSAKAVNTCRQGFAHDFVSGLL